MGKIIVGIDEAGRGPLAGPVYASAVCFKTDTPIIQGLNDSKKLTPKQREKLAPIIKSECMFGIGCANEKEIDEINILNATFLAMGRAVDELLQNFHLDLNECEFLIDGNIVPPFLKDKDSKAIVKGDSKIREIMAASILAKTERDAFMIEMDSKYPEYGFKKHKGYGTKEHREAISRHGLSDFHRKSFHVNP